MKIKTPILLILMISILSCQNRDVNQITSKSQNEIQITFENQFLEGKLITSKVEENTLDCKLELINKTDNKVSFDFKDFVFKCGDSVGRLPRKEIIEMKMPEKIPNFEQLSEEEKRIALDKKGEEMKKNFMKRVKEKAKYFYMTDSKIQLKSGEETFQNFELIFDKEIDTNNLKVYFKGEYKRLLNI